MPKNLCVFLLAITSSFSANAALFDRGNGLIYDDALNITWLKNANLAATDTFDVANIYSNGLMTWDVANQWIEAMNASNYLNSNSWRPPSAGLVNPPGSSCYSYDGTCDRGYNITRPESEMSYLHYVTLGNIGAVSMQNITTTCYAGIGLGNCLQNYSPFMNIQQASYYGYWAKEDNGPAIQTPSDGLYQEAFLFHFGTGGVGIQNTQGLSYAWAVTDGDICPVPISSSLWLFGSALTGLLGMMTRKNVNFFTNSRTNRNTMAA